MHFEHSFQTPRVIFGEGCISRVSDEARALDGTRVLVFGGEERPFTRRVSRLLNERVVGHVHDIKEHVPTAQAEAASRRAIELSADLLVAVGGGSTIGTAKAVARRTSTPILAVPTTFAGSEMTSIWGETDGRQKTTGRDLKVLPRTVIYDPDLVLSLPVRTAALSGLNALAHSAEAIYDANGAPLVKLAALDSARALGQGLSALRWTYTPAVLTALQYGSYLAGLALGNATMGLHHKLCHVLGGMERLPHSGLHAVLLPYVLAFVEPAAGEVLGELADSLESDNAADQIWQLGRDLGGPTSLTEIGFDPTTVEEAVHRVLSSPPQSPRHLDADALRRLLTAACDGLTPRAYREEE
ncbi:maleylacetate reductase [Alloalcanivorax gelatiniphagus]